MSDYILDTDFLIRCLRGVRDSLDLARELTEEGDLHISAWSQFEILTLTQPEEEKRTLDFLASFVSHPVNESIAERAALLSRRASAAAKPLLMAEAVIGATAIQHGLMLVTYSPDNLSQFDQIRFYPLRTSEIQRGES